MTELQYYLGTCSFVFVLLGMIWTKNNWLNFFVKVTFLGMGGSGGILLATSLGYIVKV